MNGWKWLGFTRQVRNPRQQLNATGARASVPRDSLLFENIHVTDG